MRDKTLVKYVTIIFLFLSGFADTTLVFAQTNSEKKLFRELEKASDELLLEAEDLFVQGKYWESARDLIILFDFHPQYSRMDHATYLLADGLYELGLMSSANKLYRHLVRLYIDSPHLPNALLGIQRIEYDKYNYLKSLDFFRVVTRTNPKDKVLDTSRYYAGLCYYHMLDYVKSVEIMSTVTEKSTYYPYALYTKGISHLRLRQVTEAINTFNKIRSLSITDESRRSVLDDTRLTLGYIFYELGYYERALNEFLAVSSDHPKYSDALLAAGWASTKLNDYQGALLPLTELINIAPNSINAEEGLFLLGRCYLKLGLYENAEEVYQNLIEIFPSEETLPALLIQVNETLQVEIAKIEQIKLDLLMLETNLIDSIRPTEDPTAPGHIKEEHSRILQTKEGLLKRILEERETFDRMNLMIEQLSIRTEIKKDRRDWRGFAEYGLTRARFLKEITSLEETVSDSTENVQEVDKIDDIEKND